MTGAELFTRAWDPDPLVLGACAVALALRSGALPWPRRARGTTGQGSEATPAVGSHGEPLDRRFGFFVAAVLGTLVALVSPVGVLARGYLFSAHMLQHLLLLLVVPPLALLSFGVRDSQNPGAKAAWLARHPYAAWALGVGAMWLWHAPTLCDAASQNPGVQHLQAFSLVVMGTGFWWPILAPSARSRLAPFAAIVYLFTACVACTTLGILVTFSPIEVCSIFAHPVDQLGALPLLRDEWGLTPKSDQEIGGLFMWVPACLLYAIAIVGMLSRYYREERKESPRNASAMETS